MYLKESNLSTGFNIDRLNYLSVKTDFKWEKSCIDEPILVLLADLLWLKGDWFYFFTTKR